VNIRESCTVFVAAIAVAAPAGAAVRVGVGGQVGENYAYRNAVVSDEGWPIPDRLHAMGGSLRIPAGRLEIALTGQFEWRTINHRDLTGPVDLALDQVTFTASLRRLLTRGPVEAFLGAGPSLSRLRSRFDPAAGHPAPTEQIRPGLSAEAGFYMRTPLPRLQLGAGSRYAVIPAPGVRGWLLWIGFSIWSPGGAP
jgi:hypothetical protein